MHTAYNFTLARYKIDNDILRLTPVWSLYLMILLAWSLCFLKIANLNSNMYTLLDFDEREVWLISNCALYCKYSNLLAHILWWGWPVHNNLQKLMTSLLMWRRNLFFTPLGYIGSLFGSNYWRGVEDSLQRLDGHTMQRSSVNMVHSAHYNIRDCGAEFWSI